MGLSWRIFIFQLVVILLYTEHVEAHSRYTPVHLVGPEVFLSGLTWVTIARSAHPLPSIERHTPNNGKYVY